MKRPMGIHRLCAGLNQNEGLPWVREGPHWEAQGGQDREAVGDSARKAKEPHTHHVLCPKFLYSLRAKLIKQLSMLVSNTC